MTSHSQEWQLTKIFCKRRQQYPLGLAGQLLCSCPTAGQNCAGVCCWKMIFTVRSLDECKNVSSAFSLKATCNDVTSKRTTNAVAFSRIHFNKIPTEAFPLSPARREPIFITRFTHIHILLNTFIFSLTSFIVQQAPRIEKLSPFRKLKAWAIHARLEKKKPASPHVLRLCS